MEQYCAKIIVYKMCLKILYNLTIRIRYNIY